MGKLTNWGRRREDNRVARKTDYALIQNAQDTVETADINSVGNYDEAISIPEFELNSADSRLEQTENETTPTAPTNKEDPRIFALVGATGGVGTTSIATQLAHEFAASETSGQFSKRRLADPTVCLIDLDFESGACAHHLDLLPSLALEDLCGPAEKIDRAFTQALVSTHECGVSLLAAPNTIGANARVNPRTIMAMLDAASELYDTIIRIRITP